MTAEPRYATRPTPGAKHDLWAIEQVARVLGMPLMPWQRLVARVASERSAADPRRFRYHTVVLTVPRQSGKTSMIRAILAQRALMNPGRRSFYTAQTGKDAAARWKDLVSQIENGPLAPHVVTRLAAGSQALIFPNSSAISPFAPTPKSLHGYTPHDVVLDEIFMWSDEQGEELMGAVKPAQITLPDRQLWLISTMGTEQSDFLNSWIDTGREAVGARDAGVAYFEWALEDGLDEYSPENWSFHPALGHTITMADLQDATDSHSRGEWNRAYMNRRTKQVDSWIDPDQLEKVLSAVDTPPAALSDVHLAFDIDPKPSGGAGIVAAWQGPDGHPIVKTYRYENSARAWVAKDVLELLPQGYASITYDNTAINRNTAGNVRRKDDSFGAGTNTAEFTSACMLLKELLESGDITVEDTEPMRSAIQSITTRALGEGWAISRSRSNGDVSLAVAMALAVKNALHSDVGHAPIIHF